MLSRLNNTTEPTALHRSRKYLSRCRLSLDQLLF